MRYTVHLCLIMDIQGPNLLFGPHNDMMLRTILLDYSSSIPKMVLSQHIRDTRFQDEGTLCVTKI